VRHLRLLTACILAGVVAAGCTITHDDAVPPTTRPPAPVTELVGTWTADVGVLHPLKWTLVVSVDGGFHADNLMQLDPRSPVVSVHFAGQVHKAAAPRQYEFVVTTQGGQALPTPSEVVTMLLSADGSELSYTLDGAEVAYHRGE
jgi:hypothetical protein